MFTRTTAATLIWVMLIGLTALAQKNNESDQAEMGKDANEISIRGSSVVGNQYYKLDGNGFTANSPVSMGKGGAAEIFWHNGQNIYFLKALEVQSQVSTPSNFQPNEITSNLKVFELGINQKLSSAQRQLLFFSSQVSWDLAFQWRERNSTATSPNRYLPHYQMGGVKLGLRGQHALSDMWKIEAGTGLMVPIYFDERSEKTGNFKFGLLPDLNLNFVYKMNSAIDVSLGAKLLYERLQYSSGGARGSLDATEDYTNLLFPFELRITF